MIAILTFLRKTSDSLHFIGVKDPININELHIENFISGQPICLVVDDQKILSLYLLDEEGQLFQIYGINDNLFDMSEIFDITLINIEKYNLLKNYLTNIFSKFTLGDLHKYQNSFLEIENQVFSNLLHAEIELSRIKPQIIKISKKILNENVAKKFESNIISIKPINKKLLKKKIDIDLSIYNIKIKSSSI